MKLTITALLFAHMAAAAPSISLGGVANAASFQPILTRGSLATIAGADLAPLAMSATQFPLPTTLAGVRVSINGIDAPLLYVSPVQINFQVPFEVPADGSAFLTVVTDGTTSLPVAVALNDNAPGIFTHLRTPTSRDPVIIHLDGQLVTPDRPGRPSEILIGFATGIGSLINAPATGAAAPVTPLASARVTPVITVGGAPVEVLYAGLAPGYAGLLQLNFRLPATLPPGQRLPLAIRSGGSVSNPVDLAVQASGLIPQPAVEVSPSSLQFGDVTVGQSRSVVVTFRNTGTGDLLIQSIVSGNAQFAAQLTGTALRIDPGAQQSVTIRYTPAVAGAAFASLAVTTNDPARPVLSIPVTGTGLTGVPAGPVLEATPPSVDFGAVNIGFTTSRTVNIRNAGGMPLNISSITSSSPVFSPPAPNLPLTLAAGAQQTVLLRYTPTTPGAQSAMLTILSNDPNRPQMNVTLTGTGSIQTSSVEVTPASLDFGAVVVGQNRQAPVTVKNAGLNAVTISLSSPVNPQFTVAGSGTPFGGGAQSFTLAPGGQQQLVVTFTPGSAGLQTSTFAIVTNDPARPSISVALAGSGVLVGGSGTGGVDVSPANLAFGPAPVGSIREMPIVVRNTGSAPLSVTALNSSSGQFSAYALLTPFGGAATSFTIPAGGQQTVYVRFQPAESGAKSATLTILSNDPNRGSVAVLLTGSGT